MDELNRKLICMTFLAAIAPKKPLVPASLARQIGAFALVGAMGFCADMAVTLSLTQTLDLSPYWAKPPAIACGLLVTFLLNRRFTFAAQSGCGFRTGFGQFRRYALACATAQSANYLVFCAVLFVLERLFAKLPENLPIIAAAIAGAGLSAGVTFVMAKFYAFRAS